MLPDFQDFAREFRRLEDQPAFELTITPLQAWCILSQLQLASRHPKNTGDTRRIAEAIARQLQERVAVTPALRAVAEAGWDPGCDVE